MTHPIIPNTDTLDVNMAMAAIEGPIDIIDGEPSLLYNGERYTLCRTDFLNQAVTALAPNECRDLYRRRIRMGARIFHDHKLFACIDRATDG